MVSDKGGRFSGSASSSSSNLGLLEKSCLWGQRVLWLCSEEAEVAPMLRASFSVMAVIAETGAASLFQMSLRSSTGSGCDTIIIN